MRDAPAPRDDGDDGGSDAASAKSDGGRATDVETDVEEAEADVFEGDGDAPRERRRARARPAPGPRHDDLAGWDPLGAAAPKAFVKPGRADKRKILARAAALKSGTRTAADRWRLIRDVVRAVAALNDISRRAREAQPVTRKSMRHALKSFGVVAEKDDAPPWFVVLPDDPARVCWDTLSMAALLAMLFVIPYNVAFVGRQTEFYFAFDLALTAFFAIDMALSFVTAYESGGVLVTEPPRIARHYLRT